MKRICFYIVSIVMIACVLIGCDSKPSGMSDTAYRGGKKAIEIAEQYLDMDISNTDAYDAIGDVYDRIDSEESKESEVVRDLSVKNAVFRLQLDLFEPSSDKTIKDDVDYLRKLLTQY